MYPEAEETFTELVPNRSRTCSSVDSSEVRVTELPTTPHNESVWDDSASFEDDQPPPTVKSCKVLLTELPTTSHQMFVCNDSDSSEDDDVPLKVKYCKPHVTKLRTLPRWSTNDSGDIKLDESRPTIKSCKVLLTKSPTTSHQPFVCDDSDSSEDDDVPLKVKYCKPHVTKLRTLSRCVTDDSGDTKHDESRSIIKSCKVLLTKLATIPQFACVDSDRSENEELPPKKKSCRDSDRSENEELPPKKRSCRVSFTALTKSRHNESDWDVSNSSEDNSDSSEDYRASSEDYRGSSEDDIPLRKSSKRLITRDTKPRKKRVSDDSNSDKATSSEDCSDSSGDNYSSYDEKCNTKNRSAAMHFPTQRLQVVRFINKATVTELQGIKTMSAPRIKTICELRPFKNWEHMMNKCERHKSLSTQLFAFCYEYMLSRNSMVNVIEKCVEICKNVESRISARTGSCNQPSILNRKCKLADYQLAGLHWLKVIHEEKSNGILADEMGLGKTIQVIAFLAYLKETRKAKYSHLIVVPSSTLYNWKNEFTKWCPSMVVEKYYGTLNDRRSLRLKYRNTKMKGIDVLLTTYNTVNSTPEDRKMFRVTPMHYVVFDEAHMLKNMTTQRYSSLYTINSQRRLLLTGTPLQNTLLELISLLFFVMPSVFESKSNDIKRIFQSTTGHEKIAVAKDAGSISSFDRDLIAQIKIIMKPFILRRLKTDVLEALPLKTDHTIKVRLAPVQKVKYKEVVENYTRTGQECAMTIMMYMRRLSNHPLLMRYYYDDKIVFKIAEKLSVNTLYKKNPLHKEPQYIFEDLAVLSDFQLYQTIQRYKIHGFGLPEELVLNSGKFNELDNLLPTLKLDGHRVLIFSQFVMMLDVLERYLDIRGHNYLRIDGNTEVTDRQDLIDQYMNDSTIFVFLLSTRAGGLGINLTSADTVIIHDIDFNPYNDKQAEDRCHRMGQTRPVTVYRLVSEGTIEEGMFNIAQEKLNLEREVTGERKNSVNEHKCLVRLLTMALGMDEKKADIILSSVKPMNSDEELNKEQLEMWE